MYDFEAATFQALAAVFTDHKDYIDVICNGVTQSIVLEATSQDVLKMRGEVIDGDRTFGRTLSVQVFDSLVIA